MAIVLGYNPIPKLIGSVVAEWSTDSFLVEKGTRFWIGANMRYQLNRKNSLQLFVGERRGGTACNAGVCYEVFDFKGPVFLTNDYKPNYSLSDSMERGGLRKVGRFFDLDNYVPISPVVPDESLDLVTCYIGLHHCPIDRLEAYLASIFRVLRKGGHFVLRDHDAKTAEMKTFCSLVHTVFNVGFGVSWEENTTGTIIKNINGLVIPPVKKNKIPS